MVFISIVQPLVIVAGKNARTTLLLRRTSDSVTVAAGGWQGEVKGHIAQFEGDGQIRPTFGYIPIGFFQLWHADSEILNYPEGHTDAGREDSHFATLWPRHKRQLLPEIIAYHLESESAPMAVNWKGRATKPFSIDSSPRDSLAAARRHLL